jgi:L-iditol 2-dehydrogenase
MCREFKRSNLDPGGFAQFVRVSEPHLKHTTLKIPAKLDYASASQVEPLACCLRNARRLGLGKGDTAVIIGLGSIGLMTAQVLARQGVTVIGMDIDALRVRTAHKTGIEHAYTGKEGRTEELIRSMTDYRGADALVFTAGSPQLVSERVSWLRDGGTLNIFASFYPEPKTWFDLNEIYHRELRIMSSYSPAIEDLQEALGLIARKEIDMHPHSHHAFPMDQFDEVVRQARGREILKAILLPQKVAEPAAV